MTLDEFLEKWSCPEPNTGCYLWTGADCPKGYGKTNVYGKTQNAHRVVWELANGPIPKGMYVCHRCDTPACVNPEHLFIGSPSDNQRDRVRKGRHYLAARTHCLRGHEYTPENTGGQGKRTDGRPSRYCRECERKRSAMRRAKCPSES